MKRIFVVFAVLFMGVLPIFAGGHTLEAVQALRKAIAAFDREDYGAAKINLQVALEREPNFAEAYMLKGLLQYKDGQTDEANASFQRAMTLNPHMPEEMRDRLEKQAHDLESGLTQQEFSHFILQFNGAAERDKAWDAVKSLGDVYNEMGSLFGTFPEKKIVVIIFNTQEFWDAWNAPLWLGGFFDKRDGKIRVRMDEPQGGSEEYKRRLRHEFTHAFLYQLYPGELPVWFHEGAAQFYSYRDSNNSFWKDERLEQLRKTMKGAPRLTLDKMQDIIAKKNVAPGLIYLAYLESEAMLLYTAKQHGDSWIPNFVQQLRNGAAFEPAFQAATGITPSAALDQMHHSWD